MKYKYLLIVICAVLLTLYFVGSAQCQGVVQGRVFDRKTKQHLSGVTILVAGTTLGVSTDENGSFLLRIPRDTATLQIFSIGWKKQKVNVRVDDTIHVILKSDCIVDYFYRRYIGVGIYSGVNNTPLGGSIDLFYPHLYSRQPFMPAFRLEAGYQISINRKNNQEYLLLGVNELFVNCNYNVDLVANYRSIKLDKNNFNFSRRSVTLNADGLIRRYKSSLGIGKMSYARLDKHQSGYGAEISVGRTIFNKFPISISTSVAWWNAYWQFNTSIEREFKYCFVKIEYNKVGVYEEVNVSLIGKWLY